MFVSVLVCFAVLFKGLDCSIPDYVRRAPRAPEPEKLVGDVILPSEQYYEFQRLDHFDGSQSRYWKQRYYVNSSAHVEGGPIFLMLGGEEAVDPRWMVDGMWVTYARTHGALMVLLEHRYYGKSQPVPNLQPTNMRYLSSRHALADTAQFIRDFRLYQHVPDNKLFLFGGGYAGSLAAWFRSKYPYLADGAVTSGAPMMAMMDFHEYYVSVGNALEDQSGLLCKAEVMTATNTMFEWWGQPDKRELMNKIFRLCDKIDQSNLLDMSVFFYTQAVNFAEVVQNNLVNRAFLGARASNISIWDICNVMTDDRRGSNIQRYADVNSMMLDAYSRPCLNIKYENLAHSLNYTSWNSSYNDGSRQWLYQMCSEFGWFQTSESMKQPFGVYPLFPFNFTTDQCIDVFRIIFGGEEVMDNCEETNRYYGGLDLAVSNVVFVNGDLDPWKKVSVNHTLPTYQNVEVINIEGAAHCADMYPPKEYEMDSLKQARRRISEILGKWIAM